MNALSLLEDLVAIPSVNPMGRDLTGPEFYETRVSEYLVGLFRSWGVLHETAEVAPGRANVFARYDAGPDRPTILLDAHQDTVPVDGMTIPPFEPAVENGRLYGRGACDVKGGMAAMLSAFARLVGERPPGAANVVMSCTCDEESTVMGVSDLVTMWTDPDRRSKTLSSRPDAAVVAEPTGLDIVIAHRGATRWKIKTSGVACHSSRPEEGINAIYRMAKVLDAVEGYGGHLLKTVPPHRLCGPATISVGRIEGGTSVNTVPDWCTIEIDRRVIPGEDSMAVIDQLDAYLREHVEFDIEHQPPWSTGMPLADDDNGPLADRLMRFVTPVAGEREKIGVAYGTHASRIAAAGVPSVVFGPGSIDQAHTKDEWIEIDQLEKAAEIYFRFCVDGARL